MDIQLGIAGKDFVVLLADKQIINSIMTIKHNQDKIYELSKHVAMSVSGEAGDVDTYAEYIVGNAKLYAFRNDHELPIDSCAKFTRRQLAEALRSRSPYQVNILMGGYNPQLEKASLYRIDYLAAISNVPFAAHGYGAFFCYSLFDRLYKEDLTENDAVQILAACISELDKRFVARHSSYTLKVINKAGLRIIDNEEFLKHVKQF
ncbi:hypothetical protein BB561_000353 [Smittium simulii]|uniref:Proteasome subunit beta n=1 Tax=Smittium simulii TaxID=133385 RepID=A0A2T9YZH1_9FUNG|nr:hypothetical protein BB561_000353 [Smittium simulii]